MDPGTLTPEQFAELVRRDAGKFGAIIRCAGITPD